MRILRVAVALAALFVSTTASPLKAIAAPQTQPSTESSAIDTLTEARRRGFLRCGVNINTFVPGFSARDADGRWSGFRVDLCRAIAAATLGSSELVEFVPISTPDRFQTLARGEVDLLNSGETITLAREAGLNLVFTAVVLYDGQGLLVHRDRGRSLAELRNATFCSVADTTTLANLQDLAASSPHHITVSSFRTLDGAWDAFIARRCDVISLDASELVAQRAIRVGERDDLLILPDLLSREPLAPVVRADDRRWERIIRWTIYALILAEEKGVTQAGVDPKRRAADPEIRRLLGDEGDLGQSLGLDARWAERAIRAVGHYGELFDRNLGEGSPLKLKRGVNDLWTRGGLMYAPPFR